MQQYASIAIIKSINEDATAVEVISVTPDSCDLAGAWILDNSDHEKLMQILVDRLIIKMDLINVVDKRVSAYKEYEVRIEDFIAEAKRDAISAEKSYFDFMKINEEEYLAFMAIKPSERKLLPQVKKKQLIEPSFFSWPTKFDISDSEKFLVSEKKNGLLSNNDSQMSDVLITARAIKYFIDRWREDEIERSNRLYVDGQGAKISILPLCWLEKIK
jgi:hypothetical protein